MRNFSVVAGSRAIKDLEFINKPEFLQENFLKKNSLLHGFEKNDLIFNKQAHSLSPTSHKENRRSVFIQTRNNSKFYPKKESKMMTMSTSSLGKHDENQLFELAINSLKKPTQNRGIGDLKLLKKFIKKISFFEELMNDKGQDIIESLCLSLGHKYMREGDIVFREGSLGTTFYIIIQGSVVIKKKELVKYDDVEFNEKKHSISPSSKTLKKKKTMKEQNEYEINEIEIKIMKGGSSFGELALLENKPRAATVICKENCHFATLEKQYFDEILKENELKKFFKKIDFLASLKMLNAWTFNAVKSLYLNSEEKIYTRNQPVYQQGDPSDYFYIIKSGEFKLSKVFVILPDSQIIKKKILRDSIPKFNFNPVKSHSKHLEIAILGSGEHFGEEEILDHLKRKFNVICEKQGTLLVVKKKEFFKKIYAEINTREYLLEELKLKKEWRNKKIKEYIFSNSKGNTFLEELIPHKSEMNLDINEINAIANGQNNEIELKIKSKLTKIMEKNADYEKSFDFITNFMSFFNKRNDYKQEKSTLFDYFLKNEKNTLKYVLKKKIAEKQKEACAKLIKTANISEFSKTKAILNNQMNKTLYQNNKNNFSRDKKRSISLHLLNINKASESNNEYPTTERQQGHAIIDNFMSNKTMFKKKKSYSLHKIKEYLPLKYNSEDIFQNNRGKKLKLLKSAQKLTFNK